MARERPLLAPAPVNGAYCRNCGAQADVFYCPVCGQETRIELPTVRHFLAEFAEQTFALQGQLWRTLHSLLFKPGKLTLEYVAGRRQRYVRPLRLYLALSILFFAVLGLAAGPDFLELNADDQAELDKARAEIKADRAAVTVAETPLPPVPEAKDAQPAPPPGFSRGDMNIDTGHPEFDQRIKARIESLLALPADEMSARILDTFTAWAPVAMFFLMPLFAAMLKLGYLGRGANYAVHLLFAVNFHSFIFLALLITQLPGVNALGDLLGFIIPIYLWFALRHVHGGTGYGTAVFVFLVLTIYAVALGLVMAASTFVPLALL